MDFNKIGEFARKHVGAVILWTALTAWGTSIAVTKVIDDNAAVVDQNKIEQLKQEKIESSKVRIRDILEDSRQDPYSVFDSYVNPSVIMIHDWLGEIIKQAVWNNPEGAWNYSKREIDYEKLISEWLIIEWPDGINKSISSIETGKHFIIYALQIEGGLSKAIEGDIPLKKAKSIATYIWKHWIYTNEWEKALEKILSIYPYILDNDYNKELAREYEENRGKFSIFLGE